MSQVTASPYRFEGVIENQGSAPQSATQLNVEVIEAGSSIFTTNSSPSTLNVAVRDTVATTTNFTPVNMGYHLFNFWASSVNVLTDTIGRGAVVTDTVYGVDYDWDGTGSNLAGGYYCGRSCGGQVLANVFDIYENATLTSISFHVSSSSVPGAKLTVEVYEATGQIYLDESDVYTLQPQDIGSWVTVPLLNPYPLFAGTGYMAAVRGLSLIHI